MVLGDISAKKKNIKIAFYLRLINRHPQFHLIIALRITGRLLTRLILSVTYRWIVCSKDKIISKKFETKRFHLNIRATKKQINVIFYARGNHLHRANQVERLP